MGDNECSLAFGHHHLFHVLSHTRAGSPGASHWLPVMYYRLTDCVSACWSLWNMRPAATSSFTCWISFWFWTLCILLIVKKSDVLKCVCVWMCRPGGSPVEMVDEVAVPVPACVTAATCSVYVVSEVSPVTLYTSVELDRVCLTWVSFSPASSQHKT